MFKIILDQSLFTTECAAGVHCNMYTAISINVVGTIRGVKPIRDPVRDQTEREYDIGRNGNSTVGRLGYC